MPRSNRIWRSLLGLLALTLALAAPTLVEAQVAAYGASNVQGYGVKPSEAYPAQLQAMLRAKGIKATVRNLGVFGVTSVEMLQRLDLRGYPRERRSLFLTRAASSSTTICTGSASNRDRPIWRRWSTRLQARGMTVIQELDPGYSDERAPGGRQTFDAQGHREVAARLVHQVAAALSR